MNLISLNCPVCTYCIKDIEKCAFFNKPVKTVQDPNTCEMFTCTTSEYYKRMWKFFKLVLYFIVLIALVVLSIKYG